MPSSRCIVGLLFKKMVNPKSRGSPHNKIEFRQEFLQAVFTDGVLSSAEARVMNSNNYPILRREPLPDATPNVAAIRGYVDSKIHLFWPLPCLRKN